MCPTDTADRPTPEWISAASHTLPDASILRHIVDAHCHPTENPYSPDGPNSLTGTLCVMSSNSFDQSLVAKLASEARNHVVPAFGYHPWYSHTICIDDEPPSREEHYRRLFLGSEDGNAAKKETESQRAFERLLPSLPDPRSLREIINEVRENLTRFPGAIVGEVGIDRAMRVAFPRKQNVQESSTEVNNDHEDAKYSLHNGLSPFTTPLDHQVTILRAQLALASELQRSVSLHCVKATGSLIDLLTSCRVGDGAPFSCSPPYSESSPSFSSTTPICLHSTTLSADALVRVQRAHASVFCSFSTAINGRTPEKKLNAVIQATEGTRLLVESDWPFLVGCESRTWDMLQRVASVHGWRVEERWDDQNKDGAVNRLETNWKRFLTGRIDAQPKEGKKAERRRRKRGAAETSVDQ